jgi:hypothetical protein
VVRALPGALEGRRPGHSRDGQRQAAVGAPPPLNGGHDIYFPISGEFDLAVTSEIGDTILCPQFVLNLDGTTRVPKIGGLGIESPNP